MQWLQKEEVLWVLPLKLENQDIREMISRGTYQEAFSDNNLVKYLPQNVNTNHKLLFLTDMGFDIAPDSLSFTSITKTLISLYMLG